MRAVTVFFSNSVNNNISFLLVGVKVVCGLGPNYNPDNELLTY